MLCNLTRKYPWLCGPISFQFEQRKVGRVKLCEIWWEGAFPREVGRSGSCGRFRRIFGAAYEISTCRSPWRSETSTGPAGQLVISIFTPNLPFYDEIVMKCRGHFSNWTSLKITFSNIVNHTYRLSHNTAKLGFIYGYCLLFPLK